MKQWMVTLSLFLYTLSVCLVPAPPSIYTAIISTLGFIVSLFALSLIFKYLLSRPPMQQTVAQPLMMVIVVHMAVLTSKEYMTAVLGNCFPSLLQTLFDDHPLWTCGFLNNRWSSLPILFSLVVLGTSKLILLVKPIMYHSADHDLIVEYFLRILISLQVVDTVVYLAFGNSSYCHTATMERVAAIYNISANFSLVKEQHVARIHEMFDHTLFAALIFLEISINGCILVKYKKNKILKRLAQICTWMSRIEMIRPAQPLESQDKDDDTTETEAGPSHINKKATNTSTRIGNRQGLPSIQYNTFFETSEIVNVALPVPIVGKQVKPNVNITNRINQVRSGTNDPSDQGNSGSMSNKNTILLIILLYTNILLIRRGVYGAVFIFRTYTRFMEYALPVIWLCVNQNFKNFVVLKFAHWKVALAGPEFN